MSALLVDDLVVPVPTRPQPSRWRHVRRGPQARPERAGQPGGRPEGVVAPQLGSAAVRTPVARASATTLSGSWQLTDRGIAAVVILFLAVVAVSAAVLVGAFLSVSDAPVDVAPHAPAVVVAQG